MIIIGKERRKKLSFSIIGIILVVILIVGVLHFLKPFVNHILGLTGMGIVLMEMICYVYITYIRKYDHIKVITKADGKARLQALSPEKREYYKRIAEEVMFSGIAVVNFILVFIALLIKTSILKFLLIAFGIILVVLYINTHNIRIKSTFNKVFSLAIFKNAVIQMLLVFLSFLSLYYNYGIVSNILWSILIYYTSANLYTSLKKLITEVSSLDFKNVF